MTNAELLTKIKAEIERRIAESKTRQKNLEDVGQRDANIVEEHIRATLKALLSFLSTPEAEKPVNVGLEEKAKEYCPDDAYPFAPDIINREIRKAFIAGYNLRKEETEEKTDDAGWQYEHDHADYWRKPVKMGQL